MIQITKKIGDIETTYSVNPDGEPSERQPQVSFNTAVEQIQGLENLLDLHKSLTVFLQSIQTLELNPQTGNKVRQAR